MRQINFRKLGNDAFDRTSSIYDYESYITIISRA